MFRREVAPGLEIRQFELREAEELFQLIERNREYLRRWLPWVDQTRTAKDSRDFISRSLAKAGRGEGPDAGVWLDDALSGAIGCHPIDWSNRNCSIGYWLDEAHQGKGAMTRCTASLLDYLFDDLRLHRAEIRCGTGNLRSCAIPQRLGFRREGVCHESEWVAGRWLDLVVWAMLEDEWRAGAALRGDGLR
jgi:ribosomal-protein-serine acetyltransferase